MLNKTDDQNPFIPLCVPEIRGNEWSYIKDCLDTNWVSSVGSYVDRFEKTCAEYIGAEHAVATVNGTAALHVALLAAGVQPVDEVLVSTLTFIAPVNAIHYVGARPVFIDAEPEYWQLDTVKTLNFLETKCSFSDGSLHNRETGRRIGAILPVHILGHPVDMEPMQQAANKYGLPIIEDATEGLGSTYKGRPAGCLGDVGCLSFNGNKIITTGGGGMLLTDNEKWARQAKYLSTQAKDDPVEYVHNEIGYNYRLTNIQAAMGCAQMEVLDKYVEAKRRIATVYDNALAPVSGITPLGQADWAKSNFWMYTILVDEGEFGMGSRDLLQYLGKANIQSRPLWQPIHLSKAHKDGVQTDCSTAERIYMQALSIPCSVGLTEGDQNRVIERILSAAKK